MLVVVFWYIPVDTVLIGWLFSGIRADLHIGLIHRFGEPTVQSFVAMWNSHVGGRLLAHSRRHCSYWRAIFGDSRRFAFSLDTPVW